VSIIAAIHEAAHAVAYVKLDYLLIVVTLDPPQDGKDGGTLGVVITDDLQRNTDWRLATVGGTTWMRLQDFIVINLAGEVAEAKFDARDYELLDPTDPRTSDQDMVARSLARMLPGDLWPAERPMLEALSNRTMEFVHEHWGAILRTAHALLEHRELTEGQVRAIVTIAESDESTEP